MFQHIWEKFLTELSLIRLSYYPFWIQFHCTPFLLRKKDLDKIMEQACPGDIVVHGFNNYFDRLLIGKWTHVGIVFDKNTIINAVGEGVVLTNFVDFCAADRVQLLRPSLDPKEIEVVLTSAKKFLGRPYDFWFSMKGRNADKKLYCAELVYDSLEGFHEVLGVHLSKELFFGKSIKPCDFATFSGIQTIVTLP